MANYTNLNDLFTGIANAIRAKKNSAETIVASTFPTEIETIRTGFDYNNQNVTTIPDYAFYGCEDLNSVSCYNLTSVGISAFENCTNLKTVTLWDNVESVGENAFKGCSSDLKIYCMFDSQPETWNSNWNPDGCEVVYLGGAVETWDVSATEEDSVTTKLYNDVNNEGYYFLIINGNGNMNNYTYNTIPWSAYKTNIASVTIYGTMTIGNYAFNDCSSLTSVTIPDSVTTIGNYAFNDCSSLTSVTIPNSVTTIGDSAFSSCDSLTSVTIGDSVTQIGSYAFNKCFHLTNVTIPASVTHIRDSAFSITGLTSITIPDSVTFLSNCAFRQCTDLTSVTIGNSVTEISIGMFERCYKLTNITIPNSITNICSSAFSECRVLTSIIYAGTIAQWQTIEFISDWDYKTPDYTIHCTDGDIAKDGTITYHTTA